MRHVFSTQAFREALVGWFRREGKAYPWRQTTDPWHILVSEIMLQQTTIPTILARYGPWMRQFPNPRALASVDEQTALRSWEGLGYYRRVRSLQNIARAVVEQHGGVFPDTAEQLMKLPGIGEYTCGALLSFAFNIPAPIVDTNVSRVIARLDNYREPVDTTTGKKYMWARAAELVDPEHPRLFNSAIMELGQTCCKSKSVDCLICPVRSHCGCTDPLSLPGKTPKAAVTELFHHDLLHISANCLLLSRQTSGRHVGMYRLPERRKDEVANLPLLYKQKYGVTRYKVTRYIYLAPEIATIREHECMIPLSKLEHLPMASPDRKALMSPKIAPLLRQTESS